jgi:hypothetical protein
VSGTGGYNLPTSSLRGVRLDGLDLDTIGIQKVDPPSRLVVALKAHADAEPTQTPAGRVEDVDDQPKVIHSWGLEVKRFYNHAAGCDPDYPLGAVVVGPAST